ncbi:MAG: LuxR C-terminal-related transcriptional regulator [Bacillota bacterium]
MSLFPKDPGPPDYGAYLCSPAELKASYDRCRALQVPVELHKPQKILPKSTLASRRRENSLLLTAAEQVITSYHYTGPQNDHIYILCGPELVALEIFAAPEVLAAAEKAGVKPGTVFTEKSCGTNALALAKERNRLLAIRGEQHYCKLFKEWWCVAGPVKNPEGIIVGYLDISLDAEKELVSTIALLQSLVELIEDKLSRPHFDYAGQRACLLPSLPPEAEWELTPREQEVLEFILVGLDDKKIAAELNLSPHTVKTHRKHIYRKVGVHSRGELIAKFRR